MSFVGSLVLRHLSFDHNNIPIDNVMTPVIYAFLPGKSQATYTRLFNLIKDKIADLHLVFSPTIRSPYIRGKLSYKTEFKDGSVSFSESFDPDDPALIDRYPDYTAETDLGDRPPTPTQQWDVNSKRKASKKKTNLSAIPDKVSRT